MLSEHLKRSDFACNCGCGFDTVDYELIIVVEDIWDFFGPVANSSACRCVAHNLFSGGSDKSQHIQGKADDFTVAQCPPEVVADYLERKYPDQYGIGRYYNFTHIDVRSGKAARWSGRNFNK